MAPFILHIEIKGSFSILSQTSEIGFLLQSPIDNSSKFIPELNVSPDEDIIKQIRFIFLIFFKNSVICFKSFLFSEFFVDTLFKLIVAILLLRLNIISLISLTQPLQEHDLKFYPNL